MFSRFFFWFFFFIIMGGVFLHFRTPLPIYLDYFGKLPGDMVLIKKGSLIHFPVVSSSLLSGLLVFLTSIFRSGSRARH